MPVVTDSEDRSLEMYEHHHSCVRGTNMWLVQLAKARRSVFRVQSSTAFFVTCSEQRLDSAGMNTSLYLLLKQKRKLLVLTVSHVSLTINITCLEEFGPNFAFIGKASLVNGRWM